MNNKPPLHTALDTTGLYCPEPVMMLHKAIREAKAGDIIQLTATDPSTQRDIPKFCQFLGHSLLENREQEGVFVYRIEKK